MTLYGWTVITILIVFFSALWLAHRLQPEDDDERQP